MPNKILDPKTGALIGPTPAGANYEDYRDDDQLIWCRVYLPSMDPTLAAVLDEWGAKPDLTPPAPVLVEDPDDMPVIVEGPVFTPTPEGIAAARAHVGV